MAVGKSSVGKTGRVITVFMGTTAGGRKMAMPIIGSFTGSSMFSLLVSLLGQQAASIFPVVELSSNWPVIWQHREIREQ